MVKAELTMRANSLNMDTKVNVLLPEDRKETKDLKGKKYPVLYILHGYKEDCDAWVNLSNIFLLCRDLDLIVVMPSANNSCYNNSRYDQNYYDWISEELPIKLKNYFPISDRREDTFIMGESMGGYGTLRIACLDRTDMPRLSAFPVPIWQDVRSCTRIWSLSWALLKRPSIQMPTSKDLP
ncbi:MAG: hypothetical protein IKF80_07350 [Erysipelotrichaceae bacterium]|nr:hypothetical protein [Erysipelotrichaceae bacterium]